MSRDNLETTQEFIHVVIQFFLSFFFSLPCLTRNRFAFIVHGLREGGAVFVVLLMTSASS